MPNVQIRSDDSSDDKGSCGNQRGWSVLTRDLFPADFLEYIYQNQTINGDCINPECRAIGFKSFPDHWLDVRNEAVWQEYLLEDFRVKKIVLRREDELAVYLSMKRADQTGRYLTHKYPKNIQVEVDPASFQTFLNNYRNTFDRKYQSPVEKRDTFRITYEQLVDPEMFHRDIAPKLCRFLGIDDKPHLLKPLKETIKQADPDEDLSQVITNYEELEFCFRYTDVLHFVTRRKAQSGGVDWIPKSIMPTPGGTGLDDDVGSSSECLLHSWSLLLPICSRPRVSQAKAPHVRGHSAAEDSHGHESKFNDNRFKDLALSCQHHGNDNMDPETYWKMLQDFAESLMATASYEQLKITECIIGIDVDDPVFQSEKAKRKISELLRPCKTHFVKIMPDLYGHLCRIWNLLAKKCHNDFVVLLGDDVRLLDPGWQERIGKRFHQVSQKQKLPFGAACVSLNDLSFPGFPTFPVIHRWHIDHFGTLLTPQFANQGGDPYLHELYSRFNAADMEVTCRLLNTIGGDGEARYKKHHINWRGQILSMNIRFMKQFLGQEKRKGICLDIVVPSYRTDNNDILRRIALLRSSVHIYVKFWFVVDNPNPDHVKAVKKLVNELNETQLKHSANYFINVIHYGKNLGASYARNTGYNYTTADWVLFLDDDVIPDENILDAYVGALRRYPEAKVFVGMTELPGPCNTWTSMLCACNVGYFYGIAKRMVHPSWGVTANLMVRGSRHNSTIQFKSIYPKTGGGEDIDFVYQFKEWYKGLGRRTTVGVPEAKVTHPWWNSGNPCYKQIVGWAVGDSLCITEWSQKTFLTFPNWIEHIMYILPPLTMFTGKWISGIVAGVGVLVMEHGLKTAHYFSDASRVDSSAGLLKTLWVALGAGSVLSAQEITRSIALACRGSLYSFGRRVDWFDGEEPRIKLDIQLRSMFRFGVNCGLTFAAFHGGSRPSSVS